jgi:hypothetical protein
MGHAFADNRLWYIDGGLKAQLREPYFATTAGQPAPFRKRLSGRGVFVFMRLLNAAQDASTGHDQRNDSRV